LGKTVRRLEFTSTLQPVRISGSGPAQECSSRERNRRARLQLDGRFSSIEQPTARANSGRGGAFTRRPVWLEIFSAEYYDSMDRRFCCHSHLGSVPRDHAGYLVGAGQSLAAMRVTRRAHENAVTRNSNALVVERSSDSLPKTSRPARHRRERAGEN
jgi:hypothetical protein